MAPASGIIDNIPFNSILRCVHSLPACFFQPLLVCTLGISSAAMWPTSRSNKWAAPRR